MKHTTSVLVLSAIILNLLCCKKPDVIQQEAEIQVVGQEAVVDEEAPLTPLDAARIAPVIRPIGGEQLVPQSVIIEFARFLSSPGEVPVVDPQQTVLTFEPTVKGDLRFLGGSTLEFKPRKAFAPASHYKVELRSVQTRDGVVEASEDDPWVHEFDTPEFKLVRMSLVATEPDQIATVELLFSGPVSPGEVKKRVSFTVDGSAAYLSEVVQGNTPRTVRAELRSRELMAGSVLAVHLSAGVRAKNYKDVVAAAADHKLTIPEGVPVEVKAIIRKEGPTGHYVEVVCDDTSVEGYRNYYYDEQNHDWYHVSPHCVPDEEQLRDAIHIDPPVDWYATPARHGFRIVGDFRRGAYTVTIDAGLRTEDGGVVMGSTVKSFTVPARSPQVAFLSQGRYLPRSSWRNMAVRHLNLDAVGLEVRHVPTENLVFWMGSESERTNERTSDLILDAQVAVESVPDQQTTTWLDVEALVPDAGPGLYELTLKGGGERDSVRILRTDMHLVAKRAAAAPEAPYPTQVWVWALDVHENTPLPRVELKLVKKNGRILAHCDTSFEGGCLLEFDPEGIDPAPPFAVIAEDGDDVTYLKFADLQTETADSDVQGEPYLSERPYHLATWTDRGVYRPGETVHLAALVRGEGNIAPESGLPVEVELIDPRNRISKRFQLQTSRAGVLVQDIELADYADTGHYRASFSIAEAVVASRSFQVEEFVPERMRVKADVQPGSVLVGEPVEVGVEARYLFGGTAADSPVEVRCEVQPAPFKPANNANYAYGVWQPSHTKTPVQAMSLGSLEDWLDDDGNGVYLCPGTSETGSFEESGKVVAHVSVFEAGSGRATHTTVTATIHPEKFYLGLDSTSEKAEEGKPFRIKGLVVDWEGNPIDDLSEVELQYFRLESEWGYYWNEETGQENWQRMLHRAGDGEETVSVVDGRFEATVTPTRQAAGYLVRAVARHARTEIELEGQRRQYWWSSNTETSVDRTPRPTRPGSIALELPDQIRVGETNEVVFTAPYAGKVLMTVETHQVLHSRWLDVEAGEVRWPFQVWDFEPNVYVSAFLVKDPHLDSSEAFLPDRAFGVTSVRVEPTEFTQEIALEVPHEVSPNSTLKVRLDLGPAEGDEPRFVTVAAVDEGILQLTRFPTPDPLAQVFARRALGIDSFETVGWTLLQPPSGPSSATGGDGPHGAAVGRRVQAVKPVALWSGLVEIPADGKATVRLDVPQYKGELRVMAVAAGSHHMGSAEAAVKVRDPLIVQTTLPRFLIAGDELEIPVFLTNMSGKERSTEIVLSAETLPMAGVTAGGDGSPAIEITGPATQTLKLANGESGTVVFQATARQQVGAATISVEARSGDLLSRESVDVPFTSAAPEERIVQLVSLEKGTNDLTPYLTSWVPTTEHSTFWVSSNPYSDAFGHLKHLLRYPYGCLEQTTSSTRPLLYVEELLPSIDPEFLASHDIDDMVMSGVDRALGMQTASGGFSYWPGGTEPHYWASAYALHMIIDARNAGYPVMEDRIELALDWMEQESRLDHGDPTSQHGRNFANSEPYVHFVLALSSRGQRARILELIEEHHNPKSGHDKEDIFLLQAALYLSGDRRYEDELRALDTSPVTVERSNDSRFYSDLRRRGFMLSIYMDLFGAGDVQAEAMAMATYQGLKKYKRGRYYTTQEIVWGVTGLGKRVSLSTGEFGDVALQVDGRAIDPQIELDQKGNDLSWSVANAGMYDDVTLDLSGKNEGDVFLILTSEGVREDASWEYGGKGMTLVRKHRTLAGRSVHPTYGPDLADLIVNELTLTNTTDSTIYNVALTDRLPAGWEIVNPRLGQGVELNWVDEDELWNTEYMDARDDRMDWFGQLEPYQSVKVVYAVRAVTAGSFTMPPAEAEAMYDPNVWARAPGTRVNVAGPWEAYLVADIR